MKTMLAAALIMILVVAAVFGLYFSVGHAMHGEGCTYSLAEMVVCAISLERLSDWQTILSAILAQMFFLLAISFLAILWHRAGLDQNHRTLFKSALRRVIRPTLMQELFSDGILNRKEAYAA